MFGETITSIFLTDNTKHNWEGTIVTKISAKQSQNIEYTSHKWPFCGVTNTTRITHYSHASQKLVAGVGKTGCNYNGMGLRCYRGLYSGSWSCDPPLLSHSSLAIGHIVYHGYWVLCRGNWQCGPTLMQHTATGFALQTVFLPCELCRVLHTATIIPCVFRPLLCAMGTRKTCHFQSEATTGTRDFHSQCSLWSLWTIFSVIPSSMITFQSLVAHSGCLNQETPPLSFQEENKDL